jgi:hypothetical protein
MTKEGKDGSYVSKPDARGVYKWIRIRAGSGLGRKVTRKAKASKGSNASKGIKSYMIHDNGNTPWKVEVDGLSVSIYKGEKNDNGDYLNYDELVKTIRVKQVYPGSEFGFKDGMALKEDWDKGNTVLLHVGGQKYIYVGGEIYEFMMDGDVEAYYSKIGPNDVPYAVLVGSKNVYFLLERAFVARDLFPATMAEVEWADAYWYYYGDRAFASGGKIKKSDSRAMKGIKMLQKRQW